MKCKHEPNTYSAEARLAHKVWFNVNHNCKTPGTVIITSEKTWPKVSFCPSADSAIDLALSPGLGGLKATSCQTSDKSFNSLAPAKNGHFCRHIKHSAQRPDILYFIVSCHENNMRKL